MVSDARGVAPVPGCPSLNPCSNGIWSLTALGLDKLEKGQKVLILVLMEYGL